ncbi:MAG: ShlB/FhaC/HecB family hemolysin secretion/activation protein [Betaproteobacteria bacterium]|nr:ShlB/FhaC/HecB family hemolysin secretion/activation protein [Betaproteobacteria bacterium]
MRHTCAVVAGAVLAFATTTVFSQPSQAPGGVLLEIKRFVVEGDANPLSQQETDAILARHLGTHKSLDTIEAAARALEDAMREQGYSFHRVIVPAQRPAAGELRLRVLRFNIAQLTVSGNQHFSNENILRALPELQAGQSPDVRELSRQLALVNEHPAKRLSIQIKESQKRDHLDAEVRVRDVPAMQTFIGLNGDTRDHDNTINRNTGYTRLTIGHQQSNLFDRDHAATVAYTTSPDHLDDVTQIGAFYWLPLYGYHTTLNAYWTFSDVDTGTVGVGGQNFDVSGRGEFWGLRGTYALPKFGLISQNVSLALDDRYFKSDLGSQGAAIQTTVVGSRPLSLRYTARHEQAAGGIGGYVEYVHNLRGARADDDLAYSTARVGADPNWNAWRYGIDASYSFSGGWNLSGRFRGQYADEALIPGEQFGIGGTGSVRGLRDREVTGDRGHNFIAELQTPEIYAGVTPFVFFDFGSRKHVTPVVGTSTSDNASSVGVGLKWNWQRKLEVSAALANVLDGVSDGTPQGHVKLHFSAFYRF